MFCQICGARVPHGRAACIQCGAPVGRVAGLAPSAPNLNVEIHACPRCGYHGPAQSYFTSAAHLIGLLFASVVFLPAGFLYLALRYSHRMCPQCGLTWGKHAAQALPAPAGASPERALTGQIPPDVAGMSEGGAKRALSWILFVMAAMLMMVALVEVEVGAAAAAMFFGGGGYLLRRSANDDRVRRREAILQSLQRPVLQLAAQRGGTLTVTEVAAEFGWSLPRAEKVLQSLEDGYRVMGDVTSDGVIVYNFLELTAAPPPVSGASAAAALPEPPGRAQERSAGGGPMMGMGPTG